ncbi:unnamed protein product, partial [Prunus brigantina]
LTSIVNIVGASCKRNEELKNAQAAEIEHMIAIDELEIEKGMNQIGSLQCASDTRWGSHLKLITSLITNDLCQEELIEITNDLCQALQCQSQDIVNAMNHVSSTKALIQELRDDGWDSFLAKMNSFCEAHNIDILDMNAHYVARRDSQLQELNSRFSDETIELLILGSTLDPREVNKSFRIDDICQLVDKFYPQDFEDHEKIERSFSAMPIVKTRLRNKMEDEFLTDSWIMYIEREIAKKFSINSVIDGFRDMKERRVLF